jgi:hypothetical protein
MKKPGILTGALVGLLLTAPLIVISALANQIAGLAFAPFDVFPFIRDITPGGLLTFVIDTMVDSIIALNVGRVDIVSKVVEQGMAIGMLLGIGIIAGAIFFAVMKPSQGDQSYGPGVLLGLLVGVPVALISAQVGLSARLDSDALNAIWLVVIFVIWGVAVNWVYNRLTVPQEVVTTARQTAV